MEVDDDINVSVMMITSDESGDDGSGGDSGESAMWIGTVTPLLYIKKLIWLYNLLFIHIFLSG